MAYWIAFLLVGAGITAFISMTGSAPSATIARLACAVFLMVLAGALITAVRRGGRPQGH